ncbi:MAG TPA: PDZ domain-containing protein [Candidatus Polarisedimenticolaceae bacterium]
MKRPRIAYRVAMSRPNSHLFEVTMTVERPGGPTVNLVMPAWTPGSYLIREYARHVQEFSAEADGVPATWRKAAKDTWRVRTGRARRLVVRYKLYAFELSVRTNHLDASHGFFTGAATFLFVPGRTAEPHGLTVEAPDGWSIFTGLRKSGRAFVAEDFDELVDCPVECGPHRDLPFRVDRKPHRIAIWGRGNEDEKTLVADVQAIVKAQAEFFGGLPYRDYTFIVHLANGRGGLEHRNSTVLLCDRWTFRPQTAYERFLALVSHEFFHVWVVKRLRPETLGPFDPRAENYTRQLWTMEGITTYYEKRFLVSADLMSGRRWMELLADDVVALQSQPGRRLQSLEESSFDTWIKLYRPDENSVNSGISYYLKGSIVAFLLDLEIRHRTSGKTSLDDVLRHLVAAHPASRPGFAETDGFLAAVEKVAGAHGGAFRRFFERYVAGRDELDLAQGLAYAGLVPEWGWRRPVDGRSPAWLGASFRKEGERTLVATSRSDGPAHAAGLYPGDELLALDGRRVDETSLAARLAERKPGDVVTLTAFRRDELVDVPVRLAAAPKDQLRIVPSPRPDALQRKIRRDLGLAELRG